MRRSIHYLLWFLVVASAVGATLAPEYFVWRRDAPVREVWRWLTGHLAHLGAAHLGANLAALSALTWSAGRAGHARDLPGCALVALLAINAGLLWGPWTIRWYAGLSGVLYGLFAWLSLTLVLHGPRPMLRVSALALFLGGLAKVWLELQVPVGRIGWLAIPVATPTHFYGFVAGGLWALALYRSRRPK